MKLTSTHAKGCLEVKRCYLPGLEVTGDCPNCGKRVYRDFESDYLSYPKVGIESKFWVHCNECDYEQEVPYQLDISITLLKEE